MTFRGETCARLRTSDTAYKTDAGAGFNPPAFSPSLREGVSGGGTPSGSPYKEERPPLTPPKRGRTAPPPFRGRRRRSKKIKEESSNALRVSFQLSDKVVGLNSIGRL